MEIPVIATDEVGLPELVDEEVGRLVPPHDSGALAAAIAEVLALGPEERRALGRAGRERVLERADLRTETGRLSAWLEGGADLAREQPPVEALVSGPAAGD